MSDDWVRSANLAAGLVESVVDSLDEWEEHGERLIDPQSTRALQTSTDAEWADDRRADPVSTVYSHGDFYRTAARDHLRAAAWTVRNPKSGIYASFVLARSSIEAAAYGAWLLDPTIDLRERVRRGFVDRCWQLHQALLIVEEGSGAASERAASDKRTKLDDVFRWGVERQLTARTKAKNVAGERPKNVDRIRDYLGGPDGLVTDRGGFYYRWLCGSTHSNPIVLSEFGKGNPIVDLDDGTRVRAQGITLGDALLPVIISLHSLQTVEEYGAELKGWESPTSFFLPALQRLLDLY